MLVYPFHVYPYMKKTTITVSKSSQVFHMKEIKFHRPSLIIPEASEKSIIIIIIENRVQEDSAARLTLAERQTL